MTVLNVSLESTFDFQRQVINEIAVNVDTLNQSAFSTSLTGIHTSSNVGIGTTDPTSLLTVQGDVSVSGIITSFGGFTSDISSLPVQISIVGTDLVFNVIGIGSTTLALV
jgi:hypothetical protein